MVGAILLAVFFFGLTLAFDLSGVTSGAVWGGALAAMLVLLFAVINRFEQSEPHSGKEEADKV